MSEQGSRHRISIATSIQHIEISIQIEVFTHIAIPSNGPGEAVQSKVSYKIMQICTVSLTEPEALSRFKILIRSNKDQVRLVVPWRSGTNTLGAPWRSGTNTLGAPWRSGTNTLGAPWRSGTNTLGAPEVWN